MKTILIAGAGERLGFSLAKRFGKEDFQVALLARNPKKLESMTERLQEQGIKAAYYVADLKVKEQVIQAVAAVKKVFGPIDVLEFSPIAVSVAAATAVKTTPENVRDPFEGFVIGAINAVNSVLPDMESRGEGALFFTTGLSALYPMSMLNNIGMALAVLRSYIANLKTELSPKGIKIAHRSIGLQIKPGSGNENDPDTIADMWYQVYAEKMEDEQTYPKGITPKDISF